MYLKYPQITTNPITTMGAKQQHQQKIEDELLVAFTRLYPFQVINVL